ncbi:phosphoglycerate mutase family protein [Cupriavidus sp. WKF15]|uniref:histidine phosphatase family protein n=1 Tax=Cupriavidus sp. WKF15 TaxID=3032282 RepID=UPI0023E10E4C|nr:histidine phosphatase family protein [Cupriavidus sp. WKF15]WER45182.1 phosphoglycerate mutase family protein [Cupriavidus sp. WKF15]
MRLYLFRHGLSEANIARRVTGTPEDPLSAQGVNQARAMAPWIEAAAICPDRFLTSQWRRAQETARLLFPTAEWEIDPRLGETDAGAVANAPLDSFLHDYPDFYSDYRNAYPGGESHATLNERVLDWLHSLRVQGISDTAASEIAVVSHSGPIACLLQQALSIGMERFPALLPAHASLTILDWNVGSDLPVLRGFSLMPPEALASMSMSSARKG